MLFNGVVWNPVDLYKVDVPEHLVQLKLEKAVKQATKMLMREGILPKAFLKDKKIAVT